MLFCYFLLTRGSEIFSFGNFTLRWDAVLLIVGFLMARKLLLNAFKDRKIPLKISAFSIYLALSAMIGARLGYLLLYETTSVVTQFHTIFLPFRWEPEFNLLGMDEFSVHGAVLGICAFAAFYRRVVRQSYLQILDNITLPCALAAIFICVGSFLNSDIRGKQTASAVGTVFMEPIQKGLLKVPCCIMRSPDGKNPLEKVIIQKDPAFANARTSYPPVNIDLHFTPGLSEQLVNEFLVGDVKTFLYDMAPYVHEPGTQPLSYRVSVEADGNYTARIVTRGVATFPIQLFEALALMILCGVLFSLSPNHPGQIPAGRAFGMFMVCYWTVHALLQLLRTADKSSFLGLFSTTQFLNILFIAAGLVSLYFSIRRMPSLQR